MVGNVFGSIKQNIIKFSSSKAARRLESTTRATKECVKNKNKIRTNMAKYSPIIAPLAHCHVFFRIQKDTVKAVKEICHTHHCARRWFCTGEQCAKMR